jgi:CheY-like chemotaxis protein
MRVLVVDDSPELRFLLRVLLEDAGMEVEEAFRGTDALARLAADEPPVCAVVLDQRMPDMSGLEVAAAIRSQSTEQPHLILFSSYLQRVEQDEAARLQVRIVLKTDLNELVATLRAVGSECPA